LKKHRNGYIVSPGYLEPSARRVVSECVIVQVDEDADHSLPAPWHRGDAVRIVSGPFVGLSGTIDGIARWDRLQVRVLISIFGRTTPVSLEFSQIEKV